MRLFHPGFGMIKTFSSGSNAVSGIVKNQNRNIIYILMPLKAGDWTLAYEQVEDDAFSEVNRARVMALTIFVFGSLGIVLVALFFSRKVVRQIEKADRGKGNDERAGNRGREDGLYRRIGCRNSA